MDLNKKSGLSPVSVDLRVSRNLQTLSWSKNYQNIKGDSMEVQNHRELKSLTLVQILGSKNPALYIPIDFLSCPFAVELLREPMRRQYIVCVCS